MSTACGALDYIVVETTSAAQRCVELLRQRQVGCWCCQGQFGSRARRQRQGSRGLRCCLMLLRQRQVRRAVQCNCSCVACKPRAPLQCAVACLLPAAVGCAAVSDARPDPSLAFLCPAAGRGHLPHPREAAAPVGRAEGEEAAARGWAPWDGGRGSGCWRGELFRRHLAGRRQRWQHAASTTTLFLAPSVILRLFTPLLLPGVKRLFDLVKCTDDRLRVAFYYALRDTVVAGACACLGRRVGSYLPCARGRA